MNAGAARATRQMSVSYETVMREGRFIGYHRRRRGACDDTEGVIWRSGATRMPAESRCSSARWDEL